MFVTHQIGLSPEILSQQYTETIIPGRMFVYRTDELDGVHYGRQAMSTTDDLSGVIYLSDVVKCDTLPLPTDPGVEGILYVVTGDNTLWIWKDDLGNGVNPDTNSTGGYVQLSSGGSTGPGDLSLFTSVTYNELVNLKQTASLVPGMQYLINDYQTMYIQPGSGDEKAEDVEPLVIMALTTSSLSERAESIYYPAHQIWYTTDNSVADWTYDGCKGVIYRRVNENNIDTPYDFMSVKFIRYRPNLDNVPEYDESIEYQNGALVKQEFGDLTRVSIVQRPKGTPGTHIVGTWGEITPLNTLCSFYDFYSYNGYILLAPNSGSDVYMYSNQSMPWYGINPAHTSFDNVVSSYGMWPPTDYVEYTTFGEITNSIHDVVINRDYSNGLMALPNNVIESADYCYNITMEPGVMNNTFIQIYDATLRSGTANNTIIAASQCDVSCNGCLLEYVGGTILAASVVGSALQDIAIVRSGVAQVTGSGTDHAVQDCYISGTYIIKGMISDSYLSGNDLVTIAQCFGSIVLFAQNTEFGSINSSSILSMVQESKIGQITFSTIQSLNIEGPENSILTSNIPQGIVQSTLSGYFYNVNVGGFDSCVLAGRMTDVYNLEYSWAACSQDPRVDLVNIRFNTTPRSNYPTSALGNTNFQNVRFLAQGDIEYNISNLVFEGLTDYFTVDPTPDDKNVFPGVLTDVKFRGDIQDVTISGNGSMWDCEFLDMFDETGVTMPISRCKFNGRIEVSGFNATMIDSEFQALNSVTFGTTSGTMYLPDGSVSIPYTTKFQNVISRGDMTNNRFAGNFTSIVFEGSSSNNQLILGSPSYNLTYAGSISECTFGDNFANTKTYNSLSDLSLGMLQMLQTRIGDNANSNIFCVGSNISNNTMGNNLNYLSIPANSTFSGNRIGDNTSQFICSSNGSTCSITNNTFVAGNTNVSLVGQILSNTFSGPVTNSTFSGSSYIGFNTFSSKVTDCQFLVTMANNRFAHGVSSTTLSIDSGSYSFNYNTFLGEVSGLTVTSILGIQSGYFQRNTFLRSVEYCTISNHVNFSDNQFLSSCVLLNVTGPSASSAKIDFMSNIFNGVSYCSFGSNFSNNVLSSPLLEMTVGSAALTMITINPAVNITGSYQSYTPNWIALSTLCAAHPGGTAILPQVDDANSKGLFEWLDIDGVRQSATF